MLKMLYLNLPIWILTASASALRDQQDRHDAGALDSSFVKPGLGLGMARREAEPRICTAVRDPKGETVRSPLERKHDRMMTLLQSAQNYIRKPVLL